MYLVHLSENLILSLSEPNVRTVFT